MMNSKTGIYALICWQNWHMEDCNVECKRNEMNLFLSVKQRELEKM